MMRRGPLDRYPVESVLHEASAQGLSGCLEFHTDAAVTVYLHGGRIYAAAEGVELDPTGLGSDDEDDARQHAVDLIAAALRCTTGWYYHDPLGDHPSLGAWGWELGTILARTRSSPRAATQTPTAPVAGHADELPAPVAAPAAERPVALGPAPDPLITLGADAWAVVVALAEPSSTAELEAQLGWDRPRLDDALRDLGRQGVLPAVTQAPAHPAPTPRPTRRTTAEAPLRPRPAAEAAPSTTSDPTPPAPGRRAQRRAASAALDGGSLGQHDTAVDPEPGAPSSEAPGRRRLLGRRPQS